MRILDRYILKSVLTVFLTCVFIFLFLYVTIDILSSHEDILKHRLDVKLLFLYYLYNLPIMFVQVSPFACLLSTLYTFSRLNHNNEIIAMRSSGLSIFQISKTVIILGLITSVFIFWINDRFVPSGLAMTQKLRLQMSEGKPRGKEKKQEVFNNLSMYGLKNRLFFINKFITQTNTMEGIVILEHDEHQNLIKKVVAFRGAYQDGVWVFKQCITYNFDPNGQIIDEPIYRDEEIMDIPEKPIDFVSQRQRIDFMTMEQLDDYIKKLSRSGATTVVRNLKVDYYQRIASPFTSAIIIMLGIPFSLMIRKRGTGLSSIGLSIMMGFLYYILDAVSLALGKGGLLTPSLSASLSHILALSFSFFAISKVP